MSTHPTATGTVCGQCGYDLRATEADGKCPECGRPVAASLAPWFIRDGRLWIKPKGVRLPPLCVNTGVVVAEGKPIRGHGSHIPWLAVAPLLAGCMGCWAYPPYSFPLLLICVFFFVGRTECEFEYFLSPATKREHAVNLAKVVWLLGGWFAFLGASALLGDWYPDLDPLWSEAVALSGIPLLIAAIVVAIRGHMKVPQLTNGIGVDLFDGQYFRVWGVSPAFIEAAAKLPGTVIYEADKNRE